MHIAVELSTDHALLRLSGEFDAESSRRILRELDHLIRGGVLRAVFDLSQAEWVSSAALAGIFQCHRALTARGGKLVLLRPPPFWRHIIETVKFDRITPVFDSMEDAVHGVLHDNDPEPSEGSDHHE